MKKLFQKPNTKLALILIAIGLATGIFIYATIGLIFNLISVALIIAGLILLLSPSSKEKTQESFIPYQSRKAPVKPSLDERQKKIRGEVYTRGFFLLMIGNTLLSFYVGDGGKLPISLANATFILAYTVMIIVVGELILRDSYSIQAKSWLYSPLWNIFFIAFGVFFIYSGLTERYLAFNSQLLELGMGIFWLEIGLLSVLKYLWNKYH